MLDFSLWATLSLGFALGLKHSLDADHLLAMSAIVSDAREQNKSLRHQLWRAARVGAIWGLGHSATLLLVGIAVILLRWQMPERLAKMLELVVALMLVLLGARALWQWRRGQAHICRHRHGAIEHAHFHVLGEHQCGACDTPAQTGHPTLPAPLSLAPPIAPENVPQSTLSRGRSNAQSFCVGAIHGLSGSAALMLLVLSTIRDPLAAFSYIAIFGLGLVGGMMLISAAFSLAIRFTSRRFVSFERSIGALAGAASLAMGLYSGYQIGVVDGLFHL